MTRNHFKERAEVKLTGLGLTLKDLSDLMNVPVSRISEAMNGDNTPRANALRINMDQMLNRLIDQKRDIVAKKLEEVREIQCPHLQGELSVIIPEDMVYIVTEDGIPKGVFNPHSKTYREFDEALMPVVGRRVR